RVAAQVPTAEEKEQSAKVVPELDAARKKVTDLEKEKATPAADLAEARKQRDALDNRWYSLTHAQSQASVDSELMCLWWPKSPLERWVFNPLYFRMSEKSRLALPPVMLTARLDGPTPEIAKRLVDDAVAVEAKGLDGLVCIDARGIKFD